MAWERCCGERGSGFLSGPVASAISGRRRRFVWEKLLLFTFYCFCWGSVGKYNLYNFSSNTYNNATFTCSAITITCGRKLRSFVHRWDSVETQAAFFVGLSLWNELRKKSISPHFFLLHLFHRQSKINICKQRRLWCRYMARELSMQCHKKTISPSCCQV